MSGKKARFIKIKIAEEGKKGFNLTLPVFLISVPLFFIPRKTMQKWIKNEFDLKGLIRCLIREGRGTRININDHGNQVKIELK